jgi:hypothetical protein
VTRGSAQLTGPPNPFQSYLLVAAFLTGIAYLAGWAKPSSIEATLPPLLRYVWAGTLLVGGALALAGMQWPGRPFTAARVKQAGLIGCAGGTLAYGLAAWLTFGAPAAATGISNIAFAAACLWRWWQIRQRLRVATRIADAHNERPGDGDA